MATRQAGIGPYQAMAEDIENRKAVEASRRSPSAREPIARRFTPLSPEGPVGRVPTVGPAAGPAGSMGAALASSVRPSVSRTAPSAAQPVSESLAATLPQGRAVTDVNPYAAPDRATRDVNPALAAVPKARPIVPQNAVLDVNPYADMPRPGYDQSKHVAWTPGMESIAAMNLRRQMAQETGATMSRDYRKFGGMSARGQQLQSQWDEAARAAFTGAMTPQQQAAYEREQAAERMRQGAAFRETPQYQMGEQGIRRDIGVADAQARGLIGASATRAEQERLNREAELARTNRTESGADARARLLNEREMEQTRMTTKTQKEVAQGKEPTDADRLDKFLNEAVGKGAVAADLPALADEWRKIHGVQSAPPAAGGFSPQALALKADAEKRFPNNVNAQKDYVRRQLAQQNAR